MLLASLLALPVVFQDLDELGDTLRRARDKSTYEQGAYQAARALADRSGPEAMSLRLELFDEKLDTYRGVYLRDWFFSGMKKASAPAETALLAEAAADRKRGDLQRILCLRALRSCSGAVPAEPLLDKRFRKAGVELRREWQTTLGALFAAGRLDFEGMRSKAPFEDVRAALRDAGAPLTGLALLPQLSDEERNALLAVALGAKDPADRAATLRALARRSDVPPAGWMRVLAPALQSEHCGLRSAALLAIVERGVKPAAPLLIDALEREAGGEPGRFLRDLAASLRGLTGQQLGPSPEIWRRWWNDRGAAWLAEPAKTEPRTASGRNDDDATVAQVFGVPVDSTRVAILVDGSGSMVSTNLGSLTCAEAAAKEVEAYLGALPESAQFNVVLVAARSDALFKELDDNSKRNREKAAKFLRSYDYGSTSSLYDALVEAQNAPSVDTIILIGDGGSSSGQHQHGPHMLERLRDEHARTGVRIHTICVGKDGPKIRFMRELAEITGGRMVAPSG